MYTRSNSDCVAPGRWITGDGEYEFTKVGNSWNSHRLDSGRIIGNSPTLNEAFALAARHYVTPVVPVDRWEYPGEPAYRCSGDIPAGHVECDFTTDSLDMATRHFERTGHNVDETRELPHDPRLCAQCAEDEYR
jgi:hypothetical protein